jgi:uncharacterized protein with HEPN domain
MSPEERAPLRLHHMLDAILDLQDILDNNTNDHIVGSRVLTRAFERGIEILSEASRHIPKHLKDDEPDIPWKKVAGIGNILRHDYDDVDFSILIGTAAFDLPVLRAALHRMLARLPPL